MVIVGLTGGIASGKSTVAQMFRDAGIPVICADELAHEAVKPGKPALEEIRHVFGPQVFDDAGGLDRAAMARQVFRDPEKRRILEAIIHPRVAQEQQRRIAELEAEGHTVVIADVPLLYESGWDSIFDLIVVVYAPRNVQEQRLVVRDGMSVDDARARLDAQMSIEEKKQRADRVVDNTAGLDHTRQQVLSIVADVMELARSRKSKGIGGELSGKLSAETV